MTDSATERSTPRTLFLRAAGFGAGVSVVVVVTAIALLWWFTRPPKVAAWNRNAIAATYTELSFRTGQQPLVFTFRYALENHTGRDYELPSADSLYKVLADGKGLDRDTTLTWDGSTSVPAGQKVNVGIRVEYEYTEGTADVGEKLNAFTKRRLAEIEGFAALDKVNRYDIRFPKPPVIK